MRKASVADEVREGVASEQQHDRLSEGQIDSPCPPSPSSQLQQRSAVAVLALDVGLAHGSAVWSGMCLVH